MNVGSVDPLFVRDYKIIILILEFSVKFAMIAILGRGRRAAIAKIGSRNVSKIYKVGQGSSLG